VGNQVATFFLLTAVFFVIWLGIRSYAQRKAREAAGPGPLAAVPLPSSTIAPPLFVAPPEPPPPSEDRSGVLRESRRQAVLLRRHFPPRAATLSHFGGVPTVPLGFTWPFVVLPDGGDRAWTFVLQVDCAAIPADGRLDLMPDSGQLYVFLDLDWGNHWVWSVRYENGDPDSFVPARVPAGLPRAYSTRATWGWPQRDEDWPRLLPSWSLQPVLVSGDDGDDGDEDEGREFWPGPIDLGPALADVDGAVVPTRYYENVYDDDGVLVRPYATFPHDWQAVRIATGLLLARHLRPAGGIPHGEADAASFADAVRRWSDRAAREQPWDRLTEDDSDAVWQLFLDFQSVTLYSLSDAVNESLDATLAGNPDAATWLPAEALALVRIRHALASTGPRGLHASVHQMMLGPPSYVQGDAEERIGEWLLLLELSSDPPIGHHFGEGVLQLWIRPDDLAARRFDLVELTASAY
jgi:hypothetical protein